MPMAASMQGGLFYPATLVYYFFGFATGTAMFEFLHLFVGAWLTALWLRSLRVSWGACVGASLVAALGGLMISRLPFLNHLAVLSWAPAVMIFFGRPMLLSLLLCVMFLAGYPTMLVGIVIIAWGVSYALRTRRTQPLRTWALNWIIAGAMAALFSAVQLLPAFELASLSRRAQGLSLAEALRWSYHVSDFRQWISPLVVPLRQFHPEVDWWKCVYLGFFALAVAIAGLRKIKSGTKACLLIILLVVALLLLGETNGFSRFVWTQGRFLHFIRYPGNLAYLALLPLFALVGAGYRRLKSAPLLVIVCACELLVYGWRSTPVSPRGLFSEAGPLVRRLQERLGEQRYLLSPRALEAARGDSLVDWKTRLYGLTNAPYRLRAVANFGEPLVPSQNYELMDRILSARRVSEAVAWMPWLGASYLLTPERPEPTPDLIDEGTALWHLSRLSRPVSSAYLFPNQQGLALPSGLPLNPPPLSGQELAVIWSRADRFSVVGQSAGWAYVAEPRYPGWETRLETPSRSGPVDVWPAMGPFQKIPVPEGPWRLEFRYNPTAWQIGLWLTYCSLLAVGWYWYYRASDRKHVAR
jgi:hypothetical protein